jgi:hypothetical protein
MTRSAWPSDAQVECEKTTLKQGVGARAGKLSGGVENRVTSVTRETGEGSEAHLESYLQILVCSWTEHG